MNRIDQLFQTKSSRILSIYFCAGCPTLDGTAATIQALQDAVHLVPVCGEDIFPAAGVLPGHIVLDVVPGHQHKGLQHHPPVISLFHLLDHLIQGGIGFHRADKIAVVSVFL